MGARFLTLSLFIQMLSFFIVLNSFSDFEITKTRSLLQSVSKTFSTKSSGDTFVPELANAGGDVSENPLDQLDSVFQDQAGDNSNAQAKSNRLRTVMKIRLTTQQFESMIVSGGKLLPVLNSIFNPASGPSYTMKMVVNVSSNPSEYYGRDAKGAAAVIARSAALMQTLQDRGLPKESMSAGIGQGTDDTIDLLFVRDPSYRGGD